MKLVALEVQWWINTQRGEVKSLPQGRNEGVMRRKGVMGLAGLVLGVLGVLVVMPGESRAQGIVVGSPIAPWGGGWNAGVVTGGWYRPAGVGWSAPGYGYGWGYRWGWGYQPVVAGPGWAGPAWGVPAVVARPLPYPVVGYPPYPVFRSVGPGYWRRW
jgi:hypothetical protein